MALGAFVPLAVFVVIAGSVGVRLVLLWRRTREVPEAALGFGLVAIAVAQPLCALGRVPAVALEPAGRLAFAAGLSLAALGIGAMACFNYRVFRARALWAQLLLAAIGLLLAGGALYASTANFAGGSVDDIKRAMRPGTLGLLSGIFATTVWGSLESFRYHGSLRRQVAVGLGDPVLADRFWLWGVASAACALLILVVTGCVLSGMTILREPLPLSVMAACGTLMSATWYLTFFAPAGYLRLVRLRAARRG